MIIMIVISMTMTVLNHIRVWTGRRRDIDSVYCSEGKKSPIVPTNKNNNYTTHEWKCRVQTEVRVCVRVCVLSCLSFSCSQLTRFHGGWRRRDIMPVQCYWYGSGRASLRRLSLRPVYSARQHANVSKVK